MPLNHGRIRLFEMGISDMLAHRLAQKVVAEGVRTNTATFTFMARAFELECKQVMAERFNMPEDQVARILKPVVDKAESEVATFEILGKFTTHGASSIPLDLMLEIHIERLNAM